MSEIVAVLGLGTMGGHAAARLAATGATVTGYDPDVAAREAVAGAGVHVRDSADAAVREATVVVLSLPGPPEVAAAVAGPLEAARAGTAVVDLSTIDPDTARTAHATLQRTGVQYSDTPVLGRPDRCGHWTLPAGGDAETVERVRPLLEGSIAARVAHVGDAGAGSAVKLANNLMFGAINAVTVEAMNICRQSGVDPEVFATTVADSGAATVSPLFRELTRKLLAGDYAPTFALGLLRKDNRLALQLAHDTGSPAFMASGVDHLNTLAAAQGWAVEDTAAVDRLYRLLSAAEPC